MLQTIDANTPIAMLTVSQFQSLLKIAPQPHINKETGDNKNYVYGIAGIAKIFGCSIPTANRIKKSGKIDNALTQIGRVIVCDADLAMELAGQKNGGRK